MRRILFILITCNLCAVSIEKQINLEDFKEIDLLIDLDPSSITPINDDLEQAFISSPNTERFFLYSMKRTPIPFELHLANTILKKPTNITSLLLKNGGQVDKLSILIKRSFFPAIENRTGSYQGNLTLSIQTIE